MKPQSKPFLVEIKSSRRIKRTHAKPKWPEIKRADLAEEQSKNDSYDVGQKLKQSDDRLF
jgi:hypothetical protein